MSDGTATRDEQADEQVDEGHANSGPPNTHITGSCGEIVRAWMKKHGWQGPAPR